MARFLSARSVPYSLRYAGDRLQRIEREIAQILERFPELRSARPLPPPDPRAGSHSRLSLRVTRRTLLH
jgi:hypothetical protein